MESGVYAIFGGSFDPLHNGHIEIIDQVFHTFDLHKLLLLPAFCSPFKNGSFFMPKHRLQMCALYAKECIHKDKIEVCDFEIARQKTTYTIEVLRYFQARFANARIVFVQGWDSFESLGNWREFRILTQNMDFVVFDRGAHTQKDFENLCAKFMIPALNARFLPLSKEVCTISSTQIRARLHSYLDSRTQNHSDNVFDGIPKCLHEYIAEILTLELTKRTN